VVSMFFKFFIYFLGGVKDVIKPLEDYIISIRSMLVCVKRKEEMKKIILGVM
jgi:hypothetical protein